MKLSFTRTLLMRFLVVALLLLAFSACSEDKKAENPGYERARLVCFRSHKLETQADCLSQAAIKFSIPDVCKMAGNRSMADKCYSLSAFRSRSLQYCARIESSPVKEDCILEYARSTNDVSACESLNKAPFKESCYLELAAKRRDSSLCSSVKAKSRQTACEQAAKGNQGKRKLVPKPDWVDYHSYLSSFETVALPEGKSLSSTLRERILPKYKEIVREPLELGELSLLPYSLLVFSGNKNFYRKLLRKDEKKQTLENAIRILSAFDFARIDLNFPQAVLHTSDGQTSIINQTNYLFRYLSAYAALEHGRGVRLATPGFKYSLYLIPESLYRPLGLAAEYDRGFFEQGYGQLCSASKEVSSEAFFERLVQLLETGISPGLLEGLNGAEQRLLMEYAAMYLADELQLLMIDSKPYEALGGHNAINLSLLSYFFTKGGKAIIEFSKRPATALEDCGYYIRGFYSRRPYRVVLEQLLTDYIRVNKPSLMAKIEASFCSDCKNLFAGFHEYLAEGNSGNAHQLIADVLTVLGEDTGGINDFMDKAVREGTSAAVRLRPPPPLQPFN